MIFLALKLLTGMTPIAALLWVWHTDSNLLAISLRYTAGLFGAAIAVTVVVAWLALFGLRMIDAKAAQRIADNAAWAARIATARATATPADGRDGADGTAPDAA